MADVLIQFKARPYQQELIDWFRPKDKGGQGGKRAVEIWHRRSGKDRTAVFIESEMACNRVGLYWHALPEYAQARRVIWDAITKDGLKLIDANFPKEIIKKKNDHEMKLELINGSVWQPVGADNFNSLVGSNPVHVTYSEYAIMDPAAREYLRPIIAENDGTELFLTTPRGYNHAYELYRYAMGSKLWHASLLTVDNTKVIPQETLDEERKSMPEELFRQEFYCDFSAANVGAILGRWVEYAEKENRINDKFEHDPKESPIEISSDIGFRDTACWWFWQPYLDSFILVDYMEDSGLDAGEWCDLIEKKLLDNQMKLGKIWLPHDARAKTFATRHSAVETFLKKFGPTKVDVVPQTKKLDKINAARFVMQRCRFAQTNCKKGLDGLRAWSFEWDAKTRQFSRDPKHDWASHPGDAFAEGALIMRERVRDMKPEEVNRDILGTQYGFILPPLEQMYKDAPRARERY